MEVELTTESSSFDDSMRRARDEVQKVQTSLAELQGRQRSDQASYNKVDAEMTRYHASYCAPLSGVPSYIKKNPAPPKNS